MRGSEFSTGKETLRDSKEPTSTHRGDRRKRRNHDQDDRDNRIEDGEGKCDQKQRDETPKCDESVDVRERMGESIEHGNGEGSHRIAARGCTLRRREPQEVMK